MENLENIHNIADVTSDENGTAQPITTLSEPASPLQSESTDTQPSPASAGLNMSADDLARLIADAESRGYRRGVDESEARSASDTPPAVVDNCPGFLAHLRPGFWE